MVDAMRSNPGCKRGLKFRRKAVEGKVRAARYVSALIVACLMTLASSGVASAKCHGGHPDILRRSGFDSDCSGNDQTIRYVGRVERHRGDAYIVYLLNYRTINPSGSSHYGQRVLIFDRHLAFLGEYHLEAGHRVGIVGASVVLLNVPADRGNRIDLGGARPPAEAWLDGDVVGFN